jgi:hypothetical protein
MITGFNPADMHALDHIERGLPIYPGVFTGIGEFTNHMFFSLRLMIAAATHRNCCNNHQDIRRWKDVS